MDFKDKLEIIDKSLGVTAKVGIMTGSTVLLSYCWSIDFFPRDVSIGDGLLFIFVAVGFGTVYLFFVASLTSFGILLRPLWNFLQLCGIKIGKRWAKFRNKEFLYEPFELKIGGIEHFVLALFGAIMVVLFSIGELSRLPTLLIASFGCTLLWSAYQNVDIKLRIIASSTQKIDDEKSKISKLEKSKAILPWIIISIPLMIGGVTGEITSGSMRLLKIRNDSAMIHIKRPYATIISAAGVAGEKSVIGDDYMLYQNATILFSGLGSVSVVLIRDKNGGDMKLSIPSDHILIFANPSLQQTR